ncbi:MAG: glycosyltransferase [Cellulomonas sp.]|nr:glycosyltransferase [Actinomycetota bacterium]MCG2798630.1 glycosyltransferase [Cellulomonas sp.]
MRIALVCLHTSPAEDPGAGDAGGMNVVVLHQAEALAALGHQVDIVTRRSSPDDPPSRLLAPGLVLHTLHAGPEHPVPKGDHEGFIDEFRDRLAELGPYDVVHSHHWFSGMAALPLARAWRVPHVQSFHSIAADPSTALSEGERPESPGRMAGETYLARESDTVVAISQAEARTVERRLGGNADRIVVVPPGVDSVQFHPADPTEPRSTSILVAARLQPLKGIDLAIEAVAALSDQLGPDGERPELIVSGAASADFDGYVDELVALATGLGIVDQVRFLGPQSRDDLAALMRGSRIVAVPSHSETYGLVALEAAASGVPVVAAASGGLREAVVDGSTGLVLDGRDPQVWAAAMVRLFTDEAFADRLSRTARQRAEGLDWTRSARALLAAYRGCGTP